MEDRSEYRPSWEQEGKGRLRLARWRNTGKLLIGMGWGRGQKSQVAHYKKNISFIYTLISRFSEESAMCVLMSSTVWYGRWAWEIMCVMIYQCLNVTAAMLVFQLTWPSLSPEWAIRDSSAPEAKPLEKSELESKHAALANKGTVVGMAPSLLRRPMDVAAATSARFAVLREDSSLQCV